RYAGDLIWQMLALLDQREPGVPLGMGLFRQTAFRLPTQWLLRYGSPQPTWIAMIDNFHLYLFDETAGYLIVDIPFSGHSPDEAILAEVETYRSQGISVQWHHSSY